MNNQLMRFSLIADSDLIISAIQAFKTLNPEIKKSSRNAIVTAIIKDYVDRFNRQDTMTEGDKYYFKPIQPIDAIDLMNHTCLARITKEGFIELTLHDKIEESDAD